MASSSSIDAGDLFTVKGLIAVVTGGGTGIGLMITQALEANGAIVYIIGRRKEVLEQAATTAKHGNIRPIQGDVTSKADLARAAEQIKANHGYVNVVVANSGISGPSLAGLPANPSLSAFRDHLWNWDPAEFTRAYEVNTTAVFYTFVAFLELLGEGNARANSARTSPKSQFIAISSMGAFNRVPASGYAYGSSKAAVVHMTKQLATALVPYDIRANVIAPGLYPSEMTPAMLDKGDKDGWSKQFIPAQRAGDAQDNVRYRISIIIMTPCVLIYGATGYTGRLAVEQAKSIKGLNFEIAGRSHAKIAALATALSSAGADGGGSIPSRVFDTLDSDETIDAALDAKSGSQTPVQVLLNCAGPFAHTAEPLMRACIRNGAHYLDISAEIGTYLLAQRLDAAAKDAGVMLLPGCGGSVAMLGCLAGHAVSRAAEPVLSIDVALHVAGPMSRGSAISAAAAGVSTGARQLVGGRLVDVDVGETTSSDFDFDFGDGRGAVGCFAVALPDLVTIWKGTGVPNVRTFVNVSGDAFKSQSGDIASLPDGPSAQEREANPYHVSARAMGRSSGNVLARAVLHTVNGYTFTPIASVEAARRALAGEFRTGFVTPAAVFGHTFAESAVDGTRIFSM